MTPDALKHIQSICRDWLTQVEAAQLRLTILPGGPLVEVVEVELRSFMTPDNTTIKSAVDVATGAKYVSLLQKIGMPDFFIDATVEDLPKSLDDKLLPAGNPPPIEWDCEEYRGETEPDPVNDQFPLISVGDRVFVRDGWEL